MRPGSIASEALRNITSGTTRAGTLSLVVGLVALVLATLDIAAVAALQRRAEVFRSAGASVLVLGAEGQVDALSCDRLAEVPGVRGAGALRARASVVLSAVERNPIPAFTVTPGFGSVIGLPDAVGPGVWLSDALADTLGVGVGDTLPTAEGPLVVGGVFPYPDDGRDQRLAFAILVPAADLALHDQCWADVWPTNPAVGEALRATTRAGGSSRPVSLGLLNNNHGAAFDGAALLAERPTRPVVWGAAAVGLIAGAFSVRRRRLEQASALHAGQARADQLAQVGLETLAWGTLGALLATGGIVVVTHLLVPAEPLVVAAANLPVAWVLPAAALLGALGGAAATRESHLFRYFKDR